MLFPFTNYGGKQLGTRRAIVCYSIDCCSGFKDEHCHVARMRGVFPLGPLLSDVGIAGRPSRLRQAGNACGEYGDFIAGLFLLQQVVSTAPLYCIIMFFQLYVHM